MTLRLKALLAVFICMLVLCGALYSVLAPLILSGFNQVEQAYAVRTMERILQALTQLEMSLDNNLWAYSSWDSAYAFAVDKNVPKAREAGFNNALSSSPSLDVVLFYDSAGTLFYSEVRPSLHFVDQELKNQLAAYFQSHQEFLRHAEPLSGHRGFIALEQGTILFASRPVLRSDNSGESHGTMIFAEYIGEPEFVQISELSGLPFQMLTGNKLPADHELSFHHSDLLHGVQIVLDNQIHTTSTGEYSPTYCLIPDATGKAVLTVVSDLPRTITSHARSSVQLILLAIGVMSLMVCVLILVVLDQLILRRLWKLNREVLAIGSSRRMETRVTTSGRDELGELAQSINTMLTELHVTHSNLALSKQKAESADRTKSEFVANMSHEIRTPLNAILGFTELLKKQNTDPKAAGYLTSIAASGKSLMGLINDILDLSKIEAGRMELKPEPLNVRMLVGEMREIFDLRAKEKGLTLRAEVSPQTPARLYLDEIRLRQVLFNLLGNAIKFTDKGYVTLRVDAEPVADEPNHFNVTIDVIDTGMGIAPDQQDVIFEAFKQQQGQSNRKYGGTGLGLTITRRLVSMMPGTISIHSEMGEGSIFRVYLPVVPSSSEEEDISKPEATGSIHVHFYPATVLLVDDDEINRIMVVEQLSETELEVIEADSGEQALILATQRLPDLILMDMRMPGLNGYETSKILRKDSRLKSVPIIIMTASHVGEEFKDVESLCQAQLRKPVTLNQLMSQLTRWLPNRQTQVEPPVLADSVHDFTHSEIPEAQLQLLRHYLRQEAMPRWESLAKNLVMDEIETFARTLEERSILFQARGLQMYSSQLIESCLSFELHRVRLLMTQFPDVCRPLFESMEKVPSA